MTLTFYHCMCYHTFLMKPHYDTYISINDKSGYYSTCGEFLKSANYKFFNYYYIQVLFFGNFTLDIYDIITIVLLFLIYQTFH